MPASWRGVFPHKNDAGATMVLFIFIGMFVARVRSLALGAAIVVLSAIFLGFTQSKTAIGVLPLALILSAIIARSRRPALGIALVIAHCRRIQSVFRRHGAVRAGAQADRIDHAGRDVHRTNRNLAARPASRGAAADHRLRLFHLLGHPGGGLWHGRQHDLGECRDRRPQRLSQSRLDDRHARNAAGGRLGRLSCRSSIIFAAPATSRPTLCNCCFCASASTASMRRASKARSSSRSAKSGSSS